MLVDPPRDVSAAAVTLADGSTWSPGAIRSGNGRCWRYPARNARPSARERLDEALRMRLTLGENTERLRVVYLGAALPAEFITARSPMLAGRDDGGVSPPRAP